MHQHEAVQGCCCWGAFPGSGLVCLSLCLVALMLGTEPGTVLQVGAQEAWLGTHPPAGPGGPNAPLAGGSSPAPWRDQPLSTRKLQYLHQTGTRARAHARRQAGARCRRRPDSSADGNLLTLRPPRYWPEGQRARWSTAASPSPGSDPESESSPSSSSSSPSSLSSVCRAAVFSLLGGLRYSSSSSPSLCGGAAAADMLQPVGTELRAAGSLTLQRPWPCVRRLLRQH